MLGFGGEFCVLSAPPRRASAQTTDREVAVTDDVLGRLAVRIRERRSASGEASYTRQLLDAGPEKCARKFGEEAIEVVIAGLAPDPKALEAEAADLLYHLLVLMEAKGVSLADVLQTLEARMKLSGLQEKANRHAAG